MFQTSFLNSDNQRSNVKFLNRSLIFLYIFQNFTFFPYLRTPKFLQVMARVFQVTGKIPMGGNYVSHSNIKTKRRFLLNLQTKLFFLTEKNKWITLKFST